jgi:hypothetical protein
MKKPKKWRKSASPLVGRKKIHPKIYGRDTNAKKLRRLGEMGYPIEKKPTD